MLAVGGEENWGGGGGKVEGGAGSKYVDEWDVGKTEYSCPAIEVGCVSDMDRGTGLRGRDGGEEWLGGHFLGNVCKCLDTMWIILYSYTGLCWTVRAHIRFKPPNHEAYM